MLAQESEDLGSSLDLAAHTLCDHRPSQHLCESFLLSENWEAESSMDFDCNDY